MQSNDQPSAEADDLDLTPPEERRARRIRRLLFVAGILAALLIGLGWYGARPASHAIKAWHARRLLREASASIEKSNWKEASDKLQQAYQLDSDEVDVWREIARLMSRTGQPEAALEWWGKIEGSGQLSVPDRRDYAACAITGNELARAQSQIDALLAMQATREPVDILLAGQLAARRGDGPATLDYAQRTLSDTRTKSNEILSAAILVLSVTAPESQPYAEAWNRIEDLARNSADVMSLDALTFLAQHQGPTAPAADKETNAFSLAPKTPMLPSLSQTEVADRLENHPKARPVHHLIALQLRAREDSSRAQELLTEAVKRFRNADDETLVALGTWLYTRGRYEALLDIVPLDRALHRRDLFLQHLDALGALGRFSEVSELLSNGRFNLDEISKHMYLAIAKTQLGQAAGSTNEWQRALESAGDAQKCMALGTFAERAGAAEIACAAYARATLLAPKMENAYAAQLRLLEQLGRTTEARSIAAKIVELAPGDNAAHLEETYLRLLQGASQGEIEQAEREAEIAVLQRSADWNARKTLGLARLQLGKLPQALEVFRHVRVSGSEPPGALAVRAAILFAAGWKDEARGDAKNLAAEHLLPEERALLRDLTAD
jgi:thioredoxin-like negative regulator of GroEL